MTRSELRARLLEAKAEMAARRVELPGFAATLTDQRYLVAKRRAEKLLDELGAMSNLGIRDTRE